MNKEKDIIVEVPLVSQSEAKDEFWKLRACGVAMLKALVSFSKNELSAISIDEFINRGLGLGAYIKDVGWSHEGLVRLAGEFGVELDFRKQFFQTPREKSLGLRRINKEIISGRPVGISVHPDFNGQKDSHLLVVVGIRKKGNLVAGYHLQDPYKGRHGQKYFVSKKYLLDGWRGGMIWFRTDAENSTI